jgi:hypothetical protein
MSRKQPSPTEITWRVLSELEACQGIYWRSVKGEYQYGTGHDAVAIWILLADAAGLARAHRRFRDVVSPHFYVARFTVSYSVMTPDGPMVLEFLGDNDAIEDAGGPCHPLGMKPRLMASGGVFGV